MAGKILCGRETRLNSESWKGTIESKNWNLSWVKLRDMVPKENFRELDEKVDLVEAAPAMTVNARRTMWGIVGLLCFVAIVGTVGLLLVRYRDDLVNEVTREKIEALVLPTAEADLAVMEMEDYGEALEALEAGNFGRVLARVEGMELLIEGSSLTRLLAAQAYEGLGEERAAMEAVTLVVERDEENAAGLHLRGVLLNRAGDFDGAARMQERAVAIDEDHIDAWYSLATAYVRTDRVEKGVRAYERTLSLQPDHVGARDDLARLLEANGQYDEALRILKGGFDLNPLNAEANLRLSMYYCRRGDLPNGGGYGLRAVQLDPGSARCKSWLASVLELQGNDEGALVLALEAVKLAPDDPGIMLQVGYLSSKTGRPAKSTVWLTKVLRHWPEHDVALSMVGENHMAQNNYLDAREYFEKALVLKPKDVRLWRGLAEACRILEDDTAAKAALKRVGELEVGGDDAEGAKP